MWQLYERSQRNYLAIITSLDKDLDKETMQACSKISIKNEKFKPIVHKIVKTEHLLCYKRSEQLKRFLEQKYNTICTHHVINFIGLN